MQNTQTQPKASATAEVERKWNDHIYWYGVKVAQCKGCSRKGKSVTRNGYCWLCETDIRNGALIIPGTGGCLAKAGSIL